jgi:hypothetical protein
MLSPAVLALRPKRLNMLLPFALGESLKHRWRNSREVLVLKNSIIIMAKA